jgi:ubiquinone/menaquinone biosynthesis C-methylase UbiE
MEAALTQADVLDSEALLRRAGVDVGRNVADFGAGREGTFTITAGRLVTDTGHVYSLDVVKEVLGVIDGMVKDAGLSNVQTVWTDLELYGAAKDIADNVIDVGILANTLFQSQKRADMLKECVRMMKPGGTLLMVDWKPSDTAIGPPVDHRASAQEMKDIAQGMGLTVTEQFEAGEYHWGLLVTT